jgi:hypothetical protein
LESCTHGNIIWLQYLSYAKSNWWFDLGGTIYVANSL